MVDYGLIAIWGQRWLLAHLMIRIHMDGFFSGVAGLMAINTPPGVASRHQP
jgi:hypothetical protein